MPKRTEALAIQRDPVDLVPLCGCAGCQPLESEFQADPVMLSFLKRTLLKRGWTGVATPAEKLYQRAHSSWAAGLAERGAATAARTGFGTATGMGLGREISALETGSMGEAVVLGVMAQGALL